MIWRIHDPVETDLDYRHELTADERAMLIEWAVRQKHRGRVRVRGTDPAYSGSTFWELDADLRITLWPEKGRLWATHNRDPDPDTARIVRYLQEVMATHPPTRH